MEAGIVEPDPFNVVYYYFYIIDDILKQPTHYFIKDDEKILLLMKDRICNSYNNLNTFEEVNKEWSNIISILGNKLDIKKYEESSQELKCKLSNTTCIDTCQLFNDLICIFFWEDCKHKTLKNCVDIKKLYLTIEKIENIQHKDMFNKIFGFKWMCQEMFISYMISYIQSVNTKFILKDIGYGIGKGYDKEFITFIRDEYIEENSNSNIIICEKVWKISGDKLLVDGNFIRDVGHQSETSPNIRKMSVANVKEFVWTKYGSVHTDLDIGHCFCCNDEISRKKTHVEFGHIIPKSKGGQYSIDNIRPVCIKCNKGEGGMFTMHMYEYIIRNQMYGLIYLSQEEKQLYVYDELYKNSIVANCNKIINKLNDEKKILSSLAKEYRRILRTGDVMSKQYQGLIKYIEYMA